MSGGFLVNLRWYVVETREHAVRDAMLSLALHFSQHEEHEVWAPFDRRRRPDRSRCEKPRADIRTPRFGRFIFIRCNMTPSLQHAINEQAGVAKVLAFSGTDEPAPVPDAHIADLRDHATATPSSFDIVIGDTIRVVEGPFASFGGKVTAVDRRGTICAEIEIFGRPTPIILEVGQVVMAQQAKSRAIEALKQARRQAKAEAAELRKHGARHAA
jgi:transcription antitermination factor NusG